MHHVHLTPYPQEPFVVGNQLKPKITSDLLLKDYCFAKFRAMGHRPIARNSRPGYLIVKCKAEDRGCGAGCGVSCNQRDAWYLTFFRGGSCVAATALDTAPPGPALDTGCIVVLLLHWCMVLR